MLYRPRCALRGRVDSHLLNGNGFEAQLECRRLLLQAVIPGRAVHKTGAFIDEIVFYFEIGHGLGLDFVPAASGAHVARDYVSFRRLRLALENPGQRRVPLAVRRLIEFGSRQRALLLGLLQPHVGVVVRPAERTRVHVNRRPAIHKDIVDNGVVTPAADERGARHVAKEIARDFRAAEHVVEVDAHTAAPLETGDVMQIIVAYHRAALRPVTARIHGARVVRFIAHAVNFVELDDVVVAAEADGHVRRVVDEVVRRAQSDPVQRNRFLIHARPAPVMVDVVVLRHMLRRGQGLPVPAGQDDAAVSHVVDVATRDAMPGAAPHAHGVPADVVKGAAHHGVPRAAGHA